MKVITQNRYFFGLSKYLHDKAFVNDYSHKPYALATSSIHLQPAEINVQTCTPMESKYQSTKLASGVTVMTESVSVPSNIKLGLLVDVGSRDETAETSGSTLLLKNTFLKTAMTTNQTVNYGVVQMAGGKFYVDYNRESGFFKASCLSHDVVDMFSVMVDCALEPRNKVACSVGRSKNEDSHLLDAQVGGNQLYNDQLFATAFGSQNLGNPVYGSRSNISNLSDFVIQKFQQLNYSHDRIIVSATGVEDHQEFVDLVGERMSFTQLASNKPAREAAQYTGGQIRNLQDSSHVHITLAFEGASFANFWPLMVANEILGTGRRSGVIQKDILNKNVFIDGAQSFSSHFSDSGLFGLKLSGSASQANQIVSVGASVLSSLRNVSQADLEMAKSSIKAKLGRHFICGWNRLEERSKSLYYTGNTGQNYEAQLDGVSANDVNQAVSQALKSNLTFFAQGGEVNKIRSLDKISQLFN